MIVICDTSPINYLILIDEIELLPKLFGSVIVPTAVWEELNAVGSPKSVKDWITKPHSWMEIRQPRSADHTISLGAGEREAISLAEEIAANLLLIDDRKARQLAVERGCNVAGTVNILESAARRNLVHLETAFIELQKTNFRISQKLLEEILERDR